MINLKNQQRTVAVDLVKLNHDAVVVLEALGYADFDLSIILVNIKKMQAFNSDYRQKDKPTDILSFPYHAGLKAGEQITPTSDDDKNLGDIIICPQYVTDDLARWEQPFAERMQVLLVHGICHLLGYDHVVDADYEVMKKQEDFLLLKLNLKIPSTF